MEPLPPPHPEAMAEPPAGLLKTMAPPHPEAMVAPQAGLLRTMKRERPHGSKQRHQGAPLLRVNRSRVIPLDCLRLVFREYLVM